MKRAVANDQHYCSKVGSRVGSRKQTDVVLININDINDINDIDYRRFRE